MLCSLLAGRNVACLPAVDKETFRKYVWQVCLVSPSVNMYVWDECTILFLVNEWLPEHILTQIEGGKVSFTAKMYREATDSQQTALYMSTRLSRTKSVLGGGRIRIRIRNPRVADPDTDSKKKGKKKKNKKRTRIRMRSLFSVL
jgi:hypothetical protein